MNSQLLRGNLELIILLVVERSPKYGLEIAREAHVRTNGYFRFKEGSLYPALHRLAKAGLLTAEFRESPSGGGPVRYYTLTSSGREALSEKLREFERFTTAVNSLGTAP